MLFQAEHGPDSQVVLVISGDDVDIKAIEEEVQKQCDSLPRGDFASKALSHSFTVFARDMVEVCPSILILICLSPSLENQFMCITGITNYMGKSIAVSDQGRSHSSQMLNYPWSFQSLASSRVSEFA